MQNKTNRIMNRLILLDEALRGRAKYSMTVQNLCKDIAKAIEHKVRDKYKGISIIDKGKAYNLKKVNTNVYSWTGKIERPIATIKLTFVIDEKEKISSFHKKKVKGYLEALEKEEWYSYCGNKILWLDLEWEISIEQALNGRINLHYNDRPLIRDKHYC